MRIQNIQTNNYLSQNRYQNINNSQPSFQHLVIVSKRNWQKDILKAVLHNRELKKFEKYLEKRHSVLELRFSSHDWTRESGYNNLSINCTYDRHSKIEGLEEVIIPSTPKERLLDNLKKFRAKDIIRRIEAREHIEISKIEKHIKELENSEKTGFISKIIGLFS